jgi:hypothetical protein
MLTSRDLLVILERLDVLDLQVRKEDLEAGGYLVNKG